jgi:capsular exopolysaccharide synthesis family protein
VGEIADALKRANAERSAKRASETREPESAQIDSRREVGVASALNGTDPHREWAEEAAPAPRRAPKLASLNPSESGIIVGEHGNVEICRHLANRVVAELERRSARGLAVVSPLRGEGKSTVACNLAIALASLSRGREVALVDLDLRRPTVAAKLGIHNPVGIERVLDARADLREVCVSIDQPTMDVYPASETQRAAHELLVRPGFGEAIQELQRRYAVVIFDTPPVLLVPDANLILRHVDACVVLARIGATRARAFSSMRELLPQQKVLGAVLNGGRAPRHTRSYYYYGAGDESTERRPT